MAGQPPTVHNYRNGGRLQTVVTNTAFYRKRARTALSPFSQPSRQAAAGTSAIDGVRPHQLSPEVMSILAAVPGVLSVIHPGLSVSPCPAPSRADFFRTWPEHALSRPSQQYQVLFRQVAKELLGESHPLAATSTDGEATGLRLNLDDADTIQVMAKIEERRRAASRAAWEQTRIYRSPSLDHLDRLTPAERRWVKEIAPRLGRLTNLIYGMQCHARFGEHLAWVREHGSMHDCQHFERILESDVPRIYSAFLPKEFEKESQATPYLHSIPWMPDKHLQGSMMWPIDMTEQELQTIEETVDPNDPMFYPFMVVERWAAGAAPPAEVPNKIWVRTVNDKTYVCTTISVHPTFQPLFEEMAQILERSANIKAGKSRLDPSFRGYLLTMARSLRTGEMWKIQRAGLEQIDGNLNLTLFTAEGYWDENIHFPLLMILGLRDYSLHSYLAGQIEHIAKVEDGVRTQAAAMGLTLPETSIRNDAPKKAFMFIYALRMAGFARALISGDVLGHDEPKIVPEGVDIKEHRNTGVLDVAEAKIPRSRFAAKILPPALAERITVEQVKIMTALHEAGHRLWGNRPDSPTLGRNLLRSAFKKYWGPAVEVLSDCMVAKVLTEAHSAGAISDGDFRSFQIAFVTDFILGRLRWPLEAFGLADSPAPEAFIRRDLDAHLIGSYLEFGWLCQSGMFSFDETSGKLTVDWGRAFSEACRMFDTINEFTLHGNLEGFQRFLQATTAQVDRTLLATINGVHRRNTQPGLVHRGDFEIFDPEKTIEN